MGAELTINFRLMGYGAALTLDGGSGKELLAKAGAIIDALARMGAEPTIPAPATAGGNGNNAEALPETKVCPLHHAPMKRRTGAGGDVWYSHKATDPATGESYWCRGK